MGKSFVLIALIFLILISGAWAFDYNSGNTSIDSIMPSTSNTKIYTKATETVTVKSPTGATEYATIKLLTPKNMKVGAGYQKVAEFEINSKIGYNNFLNAMYFYNTKTENSIEKRGFDLREEISYTEIEPVYEYKCTGEGDINKGDTCGMQQTGTKTVEKTRHDLLNKSLGIETKKVSLWTNVKIGDSIEWIPDIYGVTINEWATWDYNLDLNLIAYWKLGEASGDANDSKSTHIGKSVSIVYGQTGINGNDFNFNGTTSYVDVNAGVASFKTPNYAVSLWFKASSGNSGVLFWNETNRTVSTAQGFFINIESDGNLWWYHGSTGSTETILKTTGTIYNNGTWHHIVATFDGSKKYFWVDGAIAATPQTSIASTYATQHFVYLGMGRVNAANWNYFKGAIDEVAYFDRNLIAEEVAYLYNSGTGTTYCGTGYNNLFDDVCVDSTVFARITWNIYRTGTSTHLTNVSADCNVNAMDFTTQNSPYTGALVDQNTAYSCVFSRAGYVNSAAQIGVVDSNKTVTVYLSDTTAPSVEQTLQSGFTINGIYIGGTGNIKATWTDLGSDVNSTGCYYTINNGGTWALADWNATHCYKNGITITADGAYQFNLKAIDNAANTGTGTATTSYYHDATPPVTTFTAFQVAGTTDQNITLSCTDNNSGCKTINYNINSLGWNTIEQIYLGTLLTDLNSNWRLDEASGTSMTDQKDYATGTLNGGMTSNAIGKINKAISSLGASGSYFSTADNKFKNLQYSASVWFKTLQNSGVIIWNEENRTVATAQGWFVQLDGSLGKLVWYQGYGGANETTFTSTTQGLNDGAWHSLVITYDGTNKRMYIDGVLEGSPQASAISYGATTYTRLGNGYVNGASSNDFNGSIDEVGIWGRVLTQSEVTQLGNMSNLSNYSFLFNGTGNHTIQYYSTDNADNNETTKNGTFTTNGNLQFNFYDENSGLPLTNVTVDYNGVDVVSTGNIYNLPLIGITPGEKTFTITKTGYGTRYYQTDLNLYTDTNIQFALLPSSIGANMTFKFYRPDLVTTYSNIYVEAKDRDNNYTLGRLKTSSTGGVSFNLDQNSAGTQFDMNNSENTYNPVLVTIKYPKNIATLVQLTELWTLISVGGVTLNLTNLSTDYNVYILPGILTTFYIGDVNGNYTQSTYTRTYYADSSTGYDTIQPYLYNIGTSLATTINIQNTNTKTPIPNVTIKFYGNLPGLGSTLIGQGTTDSKGQILQLFIGGQAYVFDMYYGGVLLQSYNYTAQKTETWIYYSFLNMDINHLTPIDVNGTTDLNAITTTFYTTRNALFSTCSARDPCFPSALVSIILTIIVLLTSTTITQPSFIGVKGLSIVAFCCFTVFFGIGWLPIFIYAFLGSITLLMAVMV